MLIRSLQLIVVSVISLWVPVCPIFLVTREKKKKEGKRRALPQQPPHATFPRPRIRTRFFFSVMGLTNCCTYVPVVKNALYVLVVAPLWRRVPLAVLLQKKKIMPCTT